METINRNYESQCKNPSDIWEHLPNFSKYASECNSVTEFGVRTIVSSWAWAHGLMNSKSDQPKQLVCVDLDYFGNIEPLKKACKEVGINFIFIMANDVKIQIQPTSILFVDSWHVYPHLKRELELHSDKVEKYIVCHDTFCDKWLGETQRNGWDAKQQSLESGYSVEDINKGLQYALDEFVATHPEWIVKEVYENNNGLTVLQRVQ